MRVLVLMLLLFAALEAKMVDGIAILVKEKPITLYDVEQAMRNEHLSLSDAVDYLIRAKLESMEIKQRGLQVSEMELNRRVEQMAAQNNMTVSQLYDAVWSTQKLSRSAFRKKLKETMLVQKLYSAIAMNSAEEPTEQEMREYYRLHPEKFSHPKSFEVTVYSSRDKRALQHKIANPMRHLPSVTTQSASLPYDKLEPRLAQLLSRTKDGSFTPILPDPNGGYLSFYMRAKSMPIMLPFEQVKSQVKMELMGDEREQALKDYFDRARMNADIRIIRLPEE
jgi:parvulin-like peptidyl-prolyl isomerase